MARIDADFTDLREQGAIPKGIYPAHIDEVRLEKAKQTGNPMLVLSYMIEGGEYDGRKILFDNVMLGGRTKDNNPMPLFGLAGLVEATGISVTCKQCNTTQDKGFYRGTGDDGLERGAYYCLACRKPMRISFDTDVLQGARLRIAVDVEKREGSDRERNVVKKYLRAE